MDILSVLLQQRSRNINMIIPDVVIKETHKDELTITSHPVEGATQSGVGAMTDHAYRKPSEVIMEVGFAGGGSLLDSSLLNTQKIGVSLGVSPKETYEKLINLQRERLPFDLTTGKKSYKNMLIRSLEVTTDNTSENVLMAVITLQEVIIAETQTIKAANKEAMQRGVSTSAVQNTGTKTPTPVSHSSLRVSAR